MIFGMNANAAKLPAMTTPTVLHPVPAVVSPPRPLNLYRLRVSLRPRDLFAILLLPSFFFPRPPEFALEGRKQRLDAGEGGLCRRRGGSWSRRGVRVGAEHAGGGDPCARCSALRSVPGRSRRRGRARQSRGVLIPRIRKVRETLADLELRQVRADLQAGDTEAASERVSRLLREFANTNAAVHARTLIDQLSTNH